MLLLVIYLYAIIFFSANGFVSPFNDIGSFFLWAAIILPFVVVIIGLWKWDSWDK